MIDKIKLLLIVRAVSSRLPKIKGLGIILAIIAGAFRRQNMSSVEVLVFRKKMLLDPSDAISSCLIFTPQWYDVKERLFVEKVLKKGDYAIDVGANIGAYTLLFSELVGSTGKVTAIEAEINNAKRLRHNIEINNILCVDLHNVGVSDKDEILTLLLNGDGNGGAHSFYKQNSSRGMSEQKVQCHPLSRVIDPAKKARLMKLDVEGFEWRVLRKFFEDVASSNWPEFIMLEDDPRHRENDAVSLVLSCGYMMVNQFDTNVFFAR